MNNLHWFTVTVEYNSDYQYTSFSEDSRYWKGLCSYAKYILMSKAFRKQVHVECEKNSTTLQFLKTSKSPLTEYLSIFSHDIIK